MRIAHRLTTVATATGIAVLIGAAITQPALAGTPAPASPKATPGAANAVRFELNQGQTDGSVKFVARSSGVPVFLTASDAVFELVQPKDPKSAGPTKPAPQAVPAAPKPSKPPAKPSVQNTPPRDPSGGLDKPQELVGAVVRFHLEGANPNPAVTGLDPLPGTTNYLIGKDPSKWHTGVKSFARVQYHDVYPGIDLVYHSGQNGDVEYDFVVSPGANPAAISVDVQGARSVAGDGKGGLSVSSSGGQLTQQAPTIYQDVNGSHKRVSGGYAVKNGTHVGFSLGAHDASKPLVIDPLLVYSTFLGGSTGLGDVGQAIAADGSGDAYVTGYALSMADFPTTTGAFETTDPGPGQPLTWSAFVTKFAPDGKSLLYSTYLGGSGSGGNFSGDQAFGIAIDASGRAYVSGKTTSPDFPTTRSAYQRSFQFAGILQRTGFFALLDAAGANLVYATYLGGDGGVFQNGEDVNGIAVNAAGEAVLVGDTASTNFPVTGDAAQSPATCTVACMSFSDGGTTAGSTAYTSATADFNAFDVGATITGDNLPPNTQIASVDNPTQLELSNPAGVTSGPGVLNFSISDFPRDQGSSFLTEIDPTQSGAASLAYSTRLGGTEGGFIAGVALDASGSAYVVGATSSSALPAVSGGLQTVCAGGCRDASDGSVGGASLTTLTSPTANFTQNDVGQPVYGPGLTVGTSVASVESSTSLTLDTAAPTARATSFVMPFRRNGSSFVAKVEPSLGASAITRETYFGQASTNAPAGIAIDSGGNPYVVGNAFSPDFPTTFGALDTTPASSESGFVMKLNSGLSALGYSTLLGGADNTQLAGIAVDAAGRAIVTGQSFDGATYPLRDQFVAYGAFANAVVTELNPNGTGLQYSSFLGGSFGSAASGVAVDGSGTVYVAGNTTSDDFPTTPGAFQQIPASHFTRGVAFVVKIAPTAASAPIITGISPGHGPLSGGTVVTITGHGFTGATLSLAGKVVGTSFNSDTSISAVTPAQPIPPLGTTLSPGFTVTTGGGTSPDNPVDKFTYGLGQWTTTGSLGQARTGASATLLPSGKVLVAGGDDPSQSPLASAELYDPLTATWMPTGAMAAPRFFHTATLLPNGKVLVTGGATGAATAELYDPAATGCGAGITGCWGPAASLPSGRSRDTATLLPSGKVLVAGGAIIPGMITADSSALVYDPAADSWTTVGSMTVPHALHTATLLPSGKVLVAGGYSGVGNKATSVAELFDPAATGCGTGITGCWTATGSLGQARLAATVSLLSNGKVVVAGGGSFSNAATATTVEEYDPTAGTWSLVGFLQHARGGGVATTLPDGTVLVTGGVFSLFGGGPEHSNEVLNPGNLSGTTAADLMLTGRGINDNAGGPAGSFTATLLSSDPNSFKADPAVCGTNCGKVLIEGGSNDNSAQLYSPAPNVTGASSRQQYSLNGSDGTTWQPIDATNLSTTVTPAVNSTAVMVGNADLWTAAAGFNQDLGIQVTPQGGSPTLVAWKESGGSATFSPNAAAVQGSLAMTAGTTYTVQLVWKTNKSMPSGDQIFAGAGSPGNFSPTTLTTSLYPASGTAFHSAVSTQQFMLNGNNGSTWQTTDSNGHTLPSWTVTPASATDALLSGNADLWTENAGFNQDLGISVTPACGGAASSIAAWKESGGSAGTFSPNAAFVQATCPMTGGTQYTVQLVWKANQAMPSGNKIAAGAGNPGNFSPTSLFGVLENSVDVTSAVSTQQYLQTSDGSTWQHVDDAVFNPQVAPPGPCAAVITGNADLWTMNAGYNQDLGIMVNGTVIAWKESGGNAGTFSPNAAYVQALYPVTTTTPFTVTLVWKSNTAMSPGTHIAMGAGPLPAGSSTFSPTSLTVDLRC